MNLIMDINTLISSRIAPELRAAFAAHQAQPSARTEQRLQAARDWMAWGQQALSDARAQR